MVKEIHAGFQKPFVDNAAHEFFHIVTPLSIHSEEIQYFDFNQPKMSEHLWLYEGSTEYHAHMVQEKYGSDYSGSASEYPEQKNYCFKNPL